MSEITEIETMDGKVVIRECDQCGIKRHSERIKECVSCGRWMCDECARTYHEGTDNPQWICKDAAGCNRFFRELYKVDEFGQLIKRVDKVQEQQKPSTRFCIDCHWHRLLENKHPSVSLPDLGEVDKKSYCALPELCDLVTGKPIKTCYSERYDGKVCGLDGKMWELPR